MKRVMKKIRISLALIIVIVMSLSMTVFAEGEANEAAQAAKDAIFQIEVVYKDPATGSSYVLQTGTGFLIGPEATTGEYMITCDHVAKLNDDDLAWYKDYFGVDQNSQLDTSIQVIVKGSVSVGATIVNESAENDMDFAILKLDQPISERKTLPLNTEGADETSDCYALGFPGLVTYMEDATVYTADDVTVTKGSVSNNITNNGYKYIQHSATLASGNSGGPLLDSNGNVVGVNTGSTWEEATSFYYSLDIREITEVLDYLNIVYTKADGSIAGNSGNNNKFDNNDTPSAEDEDQVDKVALQDAVSNADSFNSADYTEESFSEFQNALNAAKTVLNNDAATADDVKNALDNLSNASSALEEKVVVDKTALASEIANAETLNESDYKADSFADLTLALNNAKEINNKADATQADVDSSLSSLKIAEENLAKKSSNMLLFIIIGIIAFVVILIVVIVIIVVSKSKKKAQPSMNVPPMGDMVRPVMPESQPRPQLGYPQPPVAPGAPETPRRAPQPKAYPAPPTIPQMAEGAGETVLLNEGSGETTLLSETNQVMAVLVKTKTGEKITIGKKEFKIGKERSKVDYCITNNSVSRVHAIITFESGEYYIKDNNSTNYTYINGEAIAASQKVKLSNGDRIKFSDEEFQFKLA